VERLQKTMKEILRTEGVKLAVIREIKRRRELIRGE
jgi:hypothetical protein